MIAFESFKELITSMNKTEEELDNFNKNIENIFGSDSVCVYFAPLKIIQNSIINILQNEFSESKEGAEWFIYEGYPQIKNGRTSIKENGKIWDIKNIKNYYDYLVSLQNQ